MKRSWLAVLWPFQSFLRTLMILGPLLAATPRAPAATVSEVYAFSAANYDSTTGQVTNGDGLVPGAPLLLVGNTLYGACASGGTNGYGTVFRVNPDGSGFTNLHSFDAADTTSFTYTNRDGWDPNGGLVLSSNWLYGICNSGGTHDLGSLFRVSTSGAGFTNLHSFAGPIFDGAAPRSGVVLQSNILYGTTTLGGYYGNGSVYAIGIDGGGYTNLHSFTSGSLTNSDGSSPSCDLLVVSNMLYGTAYGGGVGNAGTIYRLNLDGSGFKVLHEFYANPPVGYAIGNSNLEGAHPFGGLVRSGNFLYGTTADGGTNSSGTIYRINLDGNDFTNLHTFAAVDRVFLTNLDGATPYGDLTLVGDKLYGTTSAGGTLHTGTLFSINTNGTGFGVLAYFGNFAPSSPTGGLTASGNTFYGAGGDIFALKLTTPIPLKVQLTSGQFILSWTDTAFTLQAAPAFGGSFSNVLNATSPYTNATTSPQMFFRLQAP